MKQKISDTELLKELTNRFEENKNALETQIVLMQQLQNVNEKLIISENLKSNFLSNIRNEINNPLASILALSKNISQGNVPAKEINKISNLILSEAFNLDFQLRNIFACAEIEAGDLQYSPVQANISSIINNVIDSYYYLIEKKKISITKNFSDTNEFYFRTDSEKLYLIFSNLLANAIQYNVEKGTIKIVVTISNKQLSVSFIDSGVGISAQNQDLIFNRFTQIESGSTKNYGGHGLGLSVTKSLLEIINGKIDITSTVNVGSKFTITIKEASTVKKIDDAFSQDGNDFLFNGDKIFF